MKPDIINFKKIPITKTDAIISTLVIQLHPQNQPFTQEWFIDNLSPRKTHGYNVTDMEQGSLIKFKMYVSDWAKTYSHLPFSVYINFHTTEYNKLYCYMSHILIKSIVGSYRYYPFVDISITRRSVLKNKGPKSEKKATFPYLCPK